MENPVSTPLPTGSAHAVVAMLVTHGITFNYQFDGGYDIITVNKTHIPMLTKFARAFQET